jgi:hypothetical protein
MFSDHLGIYFGPCQEGQHNGANTRQVIDPRSYAETDNISREKTDKDFDKCNGNGHPDGNE